MNTFEYEVVSIDGDYANLRRIDVEKHKAMGCICYENPAMGIYFIADPDGYWLEIVRHGFLQIKYVVVFMNHFEVHTFLLDFKCNDEKVFAFIIMGIIPYSEALGLREVRRKEAEDGSFIIVYMGSEEGDFLLELTWLRDMERPSQFPAGS